MTYRNPTRSSLSSGVAVAFVAALGLVTSMTACASKQKVVDEAAPTSSSTPAMATAEAPPEGMTPVPEATMATLRKNFRRVQFGFDSAELAGPSEEALTENAGILRAYPQLHVQLEGHADHHGTEDYNLALGERRARAAHKFLAAMGAPKAQMKLVTYGEERPLVGKGDKESVAADRRVDFLVVAGQDVADSSYKEEEILRFRVARRPVR